MNQAVISSVVFSYFCVFASRSVGFLNFAFRLQFCVPHSIILIAIFVKIEWRPAQPDGLHPPGNGSLRSDSATRLVVSVVAVAKQVSLNYTRTEGK